MQDEIIKKDGTSRFFKAPENFFELYPTYQEFGEALAKGTFTMDLLGKNPEGIAQFGTELSKDNLLSDETAEIIAGILGEKPNTVNDALLNLKYIQKIKVGSYIGDGRYGTSEASAVTIPCDFPPKIAIVASSSRFGIFGRTAGSAMQMLTNSNANYISAFGCAYSCKVTQNSISFYLSSDAAFSIGGNLSGFNVFANVIAASNKADTSAAFNAPSTTYSYVIFG